MLRLGVIVNPYAGLGGAVALKGSDGEQIRAQALERGAEPQAARRMARALAPLREFGDRVQLLCCAGPMGGEMAEALGFALELLPLPIPAPSDAEHTRLAAETMRAAGVDLLVFAGGDGTARLIADAIGCSLPALGVPAGVKIHSGVYATSPEAAGRVLKRLAEGRWAPLAEREVRDIDEQAFRQGRVRARHYSELLVPDVPEALQQVKNAGAEVDELAQLDLAAEVAERMDPDTLYLVGPGSTTRALLQQLGLEATLLGVDLVRACQLLLGDATAAQILSTMAEHRGPVVIVVTAIGGQGHIFGRGNQQFAPEIIRAVGRGNIWVMATAEKLKALEGRPLLVDTNDPELDAALSGVIPVITGYRQQLLYPLGESADD